MTHGRWWTVRLAGLTLGCLLLGCSQKNAAPEVAAEMGPFAAGKKVFATAGCMRCHDMEGGAPEKAVKAPEGKAGAEKTAKVPEGKAGPDAMKGRGGRGPDLAAVGRDPVHTVDWVMQYVRNPRSQKKDSRMPPFEGKIKDDDLRALAEYLASLK